MTQIGVAMQQADVIMQQNSYCIRARAIRHNIGTRPRACGPRARCQYLTYSPCAHAITITYIYIYRGQASIPVGLKSADSLAQQEQNAGAGLYWAIWDEVPQGYRSSLPPHYKNYTIKITSGWLI